MKCSSCCVCFLAFSTSMFLFLAFIALVQTCRLQRIVSFKKWLLTRMKIPLFVFVSGISDLELLLHVMGYRETFGRGTMKLWDDVAEKVRKAFPTDMAGLRGRTCRERTIREIKGLCGKQQ